MVCAKTTKTTLKKPVAMEETECRGEKLPSLAPYGTGMPGYDSGSTADKQMIS